MHVATRFIVMTDTNGITVMKSTNVEYTYMYREVRGKYPNPYGQLRGKIWEWALIPGFSIYFLFFYFLPW